MPSNFATNEAKFLPATRAGTPHGVTPVLQLDLHPALVIRAHLKILPLNQALEGVARLLALVILTILVHRTARLADERIAIQTAQTNELAQILLAAELTALAAVQALGDGRVVLDLLCLIREEEVAAILHESCKVLGMKDPCAPGGRVVRFVFAGVDELWDDAAVHTVFADRVAIDADADDLFLHADDTDCRWVSGLR